MKNLIIIAAMTAIGFSSVGYAQTTTSMEKKSKTSMSSSKKMKGGKKEKGVMVGGAMMVASKNIVENAVNANNVTTLVAAVKAAGLVETLSGKCPFTVFAPTDDAFKKIPQSTLNELLKPENKGKLTSILTYHVIAGKLTANKLKNGAKLKTVNGETLTVTRKGSKVMINGVQVMIPNVISSNGVTHVIGTVLMPQM